MKNKTRRTLLLGAVAALGVPALQGCFPLVATGVGMGAAMYSDRRTSGAIIEDEGIEWRTARAFRERFGDAIHVNATAFNRNVLLTGEVPDEATRGEVERWAKSVANVRAVINETVVGGITSLTSRSNDALLTSKVKARMVDAGSVPARHVKVVSEAGSVFLLGIVTAREADAATDVARTTSGVSRVVRAFEYISEEEARRLDARIGDKPG
jgi:osmotically-inducible protein OsmY